MATMVDVEALRAKAKLRGILNKSGKVVFQKCITLEDLDSITLEDLDSIPTVEVKPVAEEKPKTVHASWYQHCFEMYCSNCHEEAPRVYIDKYTVEYRYPNRCPVCKAIMDGCD